MTVRRKILSVAMGLTLLVPATAPLPAAARSDAVAPSSAARTAADYPVQVTLGAPPSAVVAAPNPAVPTEYGLVSETPGLRLYMNRDDSKLIVEDRRSGKLWTSNPLEPLGEQKTILDDAVYQINYTNARRQMTNLASSASEKPVLTFTNIPGGVRVGYEMQKLKIKLDIDYVIKEEPRVDVPGTVAYLEVTIPESGLQETGDCAIATSTTCAKITSLEVLPLFGAAPVGSTGYLTVPDGVGAIVTFKNEHAQYRQRYSAQIYGTDAASQTFQGGRGGGTFRNTRPHMPIWGLKHDAAAYAGIVTKGEFQANINGYLAGYITNANRGSVEFLYRRQASIPRRRTLFVNRIEDDWLRGDRQVRYVLLNNEDANYAGIAKAYRDYLMKTRGLKRLPREAPRPQIDLYMGITRRSAFRDDMVPMTTFEQAITMAKGFMERGIKNFDLHLIGWNDDGDRGRWPRRYPAEESIGGNDGLRRLTAFAKENGLRVYLNDDYTRGYLASSGGIFGQIPYVRNIWPNWSYGFNSRWDTVRGVNKLPVTFGQRGAFQTYLLNTVVARTSYAARDFPKHKSLGANGILLSISGYFVSSDTNERHPLSRGDAAGEYMKIADMSREMLGQATVAGPNAYVLGHTDRVYEAPELALDAFADDAVPLYHIATNGLVTRTTWAANLRNDQRTEFLRVVEYGLQPVYQLTHQPSSDLIRTTANFMFSSEYSDWIDPAAKEYALVRDEFGYLNGQFITNHQILADNVNRVTYEDGSTLTVNYSPEAYTAPDGTVVAGFGYTLKKGGTR